MFGVLNFKLSKCTEVHSPQFHKILRENLHFLS